MFDSPKTQQRLGKFAWVMAWFGLVAGQLHALSRFATADGKADLQLPLTRAWAEPAARALRPLLTWADPDLVYLTYGKIWLPVFAAFTLCAFVVHQRRRPAGFEKWAWRLALTANVWATLAVAAADWTQWGATPNAFFDAAFLITVPGLLLTLAGSTVLGIALLRRRMRPRTPAWLLVTVIPLALAILQVTSMGSAALPVMFAFGILGRHIARERAHAPLPGDPVRGADAVPIDQGADALPHDQGVAR
jgi:hypothetical protein